MSNKKTTSKKVSRLVKDKPLSKGAAQKLANGKIHKRPAIPELSPVNAIERIARMLREEIHTLESKKASGE